MKPSLLAGVLAGYTVVFLLAPLFQYLAGLILGIDGIHLSFEYYKLTCEFELVSGAGNFISIIVLLTPTLLYVFNIEINSYSLTRITPGFYRNFFIVYQLVLIGYLLVNVFVGAVTVILKLDTGNEYAAIINDILGLTMPASFLVILVILILLTLYINITTKRILKYINV